MLDIEGFLNKYNLLQGLKKEMYDLYKHKHNFFCTELQNKNITYFGEMFENFSERMGNFDNDEIRSFLILLVSSIKLRDTSFDENEERQIHESITAWALETNPSFVQSREFAKVLLYDSEKTEIVFSEIKNKLYFNFALFLSGNYNTMSEEEKKCFSLKNEFMLDFFCITKKIRFVHNDNPIFKELKNEIKYEKYGKELSNRWMGVQLKYSEWFEIKDTKLLRISIIKNILSDELSAGEISNVIKNSKRTPDPSSIIELLDINKVDAARLKDILLEIKDGYEKKNKYEKWLELSHKIVDENNARVYFENFDLLKDRFLLSDRVYSENSVLLKDRFLLSDRLYELFKACTKEKLFSAEEMLYVLKENPELKIDFEIKYLKNEIKIYEFEKVQEFLKHNPQYIDEYFVPENTEINYNSVIFLKQNKGLKILENSFWLKLCLKYNFLDTVQKIFDNLDEDVLSELTENTKLNMLKTFDKGGYHRNANLVEIIKINLFGEDFIKKEKLEQEKKKYLESLEKHSYYYIDQLVKNLKEEFREDEVFMQEVKKRILNQKQNQLFFMKSFKHIISFSDTEILSVAKKIIEKEGE